MNKGWELKTLAAVSAINYGYTESASSERVGPRFLRITDIKDDHVDWDSVPYCKIESADVPKYRLASGDIVFARTGATTGKSFLVDDPPDSVFASYLIRLRLLDKQLLPEFVSLFFQTAGYWQSIKDGSSGSAQGGFNATKLGALMLPVPSLAEQQRIVGILDKTFEGISIAKANAEKNLQNARALFESHLQSVFADVWRTCELVTLLDLATDITDGDHLPPPKSPTGVPFITIGNIVKETREIDFSDTFMVPHAYFDALKPNKKPRQGDVLYTVTGSFGIPVIVRDDVEFCFQRHIGLIRPKPETISSWLYYLLLSPQLFKQANDGATGTAQKTVSLKLLRRFEVPKVAPKQQKAAVAKLDALSEETQHLSTIYESKLAALEALKKSLLYQAFAGEL
jgi:type I restriction enzyme S subunit